MLSDHPAGRLVSFVAFALQGFLLISLANSATQDDSAPLHGLISLATVCLGVLNFVSTMTTSRSRQEYIRARDVCILLNAVYGWLYVPVVVLYYENAEDTELIAWFLRWSGGGFASGGAINGLLGMVVWTGAYLTKLGINPWVVDWLSGQNTDAPQAATNGNTAPQQPPPARPAPQRGARNEGDDDAELREAMRLSEETYRQEQARRQLLYYQGAPQQPPPPAPAHHYVHQHSVPPPAYDPLADTQDVGPVPPLPACPSVPAPAAHPVVNPQASPLLAYGQEGQNEARSLFLVLNGLLLLSMLSGSLHCHPLIRLSLIGLALTSIFQIYASSLRNFSESIMHFCLGMCGWVLVVGSVFGRGHSPAGGIMGWVTYCLLLLSLERHVFSKAAPGWFRRLDEAAEARKTRRRQRRGINLWGVRR